MELKRLIAEDSKSALQNVRTTYGEDALIVSTNKIGTKTEVICAVDLQPDNATFEEDLATVAPTAASKEQAAPFSASLSTVIDKKPAASDPGLANLVATIQQELLELRESVAAHVDANPHELLPQTANDTATSLCERALRQQYGSLRTKPMFEQRSWEGAQLFIGRPGVGKTTCIENLLAAAQNADNSQKPFALIAFSSDETNSDNASEHWLKLAKISQRYGMPCAQAIGIANLQRLVTQLGQQHTVLIDTCTEQLSDIQELTGSVQAAVHCCIGADFSPQAVNNYQTADTTLLQSTIITRTDLADDMSPLFNALSQAQAQIIAVSNDMTSAPDAE